MDHLTVTWKVSDGICQHVDVLEQGKERPFSLGKSLFIGEEEYEDLDEIIARHVQPMAANVREITSHKYYYKGFPFSRHIHQNRELVSNCLIHEKANNPKRIP